MNKWQLLKADNNIEKDWNEKLANYSDCSLFQSFNWGCHRENFGWEALRWMQLEEGGGVVSMVQVLVKRLPLGIVAAWITGGPVGAVDAWVEDIMPLIKKETQSRVLYIRMLNNKPVNDFDTTRLSEHGWSRPRTKLRSGLSMLFGLDSDLELIKQSFSKDWKRNLRKGEKRNQNISQWNEPDIDKIYELYQSMEQLKGLDEQFSLEELKAIFKYMGEKIVVYKSEDDAGKLLAIRGCFILGQYGWDLFAAASLDARKVSATYILFWRLMERCKELGVKQYDMMGIDPENNKGVYYFKQGTGAKEIEYLGEWEWASMPLVKLVINTAMKYKFI